MACWAVSWLASLTTILVAATSSDASLPCSTLRPVSYSHLRAVSTAILMSAILWATAWFLPMALPNCCRVVACSTTRFSRWVISPRFTAKEKRTSRFIT